MRSALTHLVIALVLGLCAFLGYGFWYTTVSHKSQQVAHLQSQIDDANKNINRIATARTALAEIANDEERVKSYFVPEAGIVAFITFLESLGPPQNSKVSVLSVANSGSVSKPILLLTLSITGGFDSVMRTVGAVEYAPYDLSLSKLSVLQTDKSTWQANLSLSVGSASVASTTPSRPK
jgi:hypothetical protein